MRKLAAVFIVALGGVLALPTADLSAQPSSPSSSQRAKKPGRSCDQLDRGSQADKECVDRQAKAREARQARQAACKQYAPKTQERRDCLAQQRKAQRVTKTTG
jgi:hypothetical protein